MMAELASSSGPSFAPLAANTCALIAEAESSPVAPPSPWLSQSTQVTTKPPLARRAIWTLFWSPSVALLTRISVPILTAELTVMEGLRSLRFLMTRPVCGTGIIVFNSLKSPAVSCIANRQDPGRAE